MSDRTIEYPNNLTAAEYHELAVSSAIHPSLIERNFSHIEGETVYDYLFISSALPRKNAGRVTDGFLKAYLHLMAGGLWISGLDPQLNWLPMEWGRMKPSLPRIDWEKGKPVKYESPPKTPNRVTYFDVADCIWDIVARRYNIKRYHSPLALRLLDLLAPLIFWEWVKRHPEIPIILCEGEKKAACLLSLGFVAISLPGIWNGRVGKKDFDERLHPDLVPLAQPGRKFIILFDYETKLKTRWSVYQATVRTGKAIESQGCVCEVALLPGPEKGVDDFVVERGSNANALLTAIIDDALSLKDYQRSFIVKHQGLRKYKPNEVVNVQYLTSALVVPAEQQSKTKNLKEKNNDATQTAPDVLIQQNAPLNLQQLALELLSESKTRTQDAAKVKKAEGRGQRAEGLQCSVGSTPTLIARHQIEDFGVGLKPLLPSVVAEAPNQNSLLPSASCPLPFVLTSETVSTQVQIPDEPQPPKSDFGLAFSVRLPKTGLVGLLSGMGTGKTELMRYWRKANPGLKFLNNGHRVNLLKNLGVRLETLMYSDLGYAAMATAEALSITIDSLHKLNTQALQYGCVFIDEACQYLTHLLHSNTCKSHRAIILEVLHHIVYNAPLVVIADAHLDDVTIDFFRAMRPPGEQPYIIENQWNNGDRTIYWYEGQDSSALVAQISAALMLGQKIMVVSDSKRFIKKLEKSLSVQIEQEASPGETDKRKNVAQEVAKSKVASQRSQVKSLPPTCDFKLPTSNLRIWSIHSDNSGSEENVAFIKDITNAVKNIDVLLTSPSLGTGVDIADYHFDLVFGVFHAISQTATECAQQLWRYRPKVPIHVWVAPKPPFGYLDTNPTKIKERLLQTNEITAFLLRIDRETGKRGAEKDWALDAYCQIIANRHQSINNLRANLQDLLTQMGNSIVPVGEEHDAIAWEYLKNAADALDTAHNHAVAKAKNISKSEYRARQTKDYLSPDEINECEKFRIHDAYGMEVTESLVEKDDGGRLIRAFAALEAILSPPDEIILDSKTGKQYPAPPAFVTGKDRAERDKLPFCMDWGNYSAKWLARFNLGLHDILKRLVTSSEITASDTHLLNMTASAIQCAAHIKAILGFTVPTDCQPIWLLATLLEQLGLKLVCRKIGPRGQQVKFFSLSKLELEFALQVIAHRQQQRADYFQTQSSLGLERVSHPVSTPPDNCIGNPHLSGGDTTQLQEAEGQEFLSAAQALPCPEASSPDRTTLLHCVETLRSGLGKGAEAVKGILKRWAGDLRWEVVLQLEAIAQEELRSLEAAIPEFYEWLDELVLPMEG
ncbi:plasmid replication protein, CyRepA1 family [Dendronalium phyllosphericum]|uniref:plasmid replication protein, CyRepA1 family n=1 Tax=Dendronalium phyllosphericum TaxID=2840445 RepID=UPI001CED69A6|nr:plasmid replication protein, CyRepA1 family [Dendronalium phyllosphericum]